MIAQSILMDSEAKRQRVLQIIAKLPIERPLILTVDVFRAKRSNTANARLWALHQKAADATGMPAADLHEIALCRFYGYEEKKLGGIVRQIPNERSSAQNVKDFAAFMEATEAWYITELGIFLE